MRVWFSGRVSVVVVAAAVLSLAFVSGSGASSARLRVVTQFQPPGAGRIELIAVTFRARFSGPAAPVHPLVKVTLPGAGPPHTYGLLSGTRLSRVQGKVATYVWLSLALKPLGAKPSPDQPLVGESRNIVPIGSGSVALHPEAQELTIDNSDEAEFAQLGSALKAAGVSSLSATSFGVSAYDSGTLFHWTPTQLDGVWNAAMETLNQHHSSTVLPIGQIEVLTGLHFAGGPSTSGPTTGTSGQSATSPGLTPTSGSLRLSCPSAVTQGQSIQITISVGTPSTPVNVLYTLPNGSTLPHVAIPNATNPSIKTDSVGTSLPGIWHIDASAAGQTATCTVTVNP
jgi:hypothetical protein